MTLNRRGFIAALLALPAAIAGYVAAPKLLWRRDAIKLAAEPLAWLWQVGDLVTIPGHYASLTRERRLRVFMITENLNLAPDGLVPTSALHPRWPLTKDRYWVRPYLISNRAPITVEWGEGIDYEIVEGRKA